jgi:hypothetical protein
MCLHTYPIGTEAGSKSKAIYTHQQFNQVTTTLFQENFQVKQMEMSEGITAWYKGKNVTRIAQSIQ